MAHYRSIVMDCLPAAVLSVGSCLVGLVSRPLLASPEAGHEQGKIRVRVDRGRRPGDTPVSALTGRHPPAAREASYLFRLEFGALHLLSAWFQRVTGGS